jgi:YD repeat-containing protein
LNRLIRAETLDAAWGTTYTYDGWGNLTNKTPTKGSPPSLAVTYDPALNMPVGSPAPNVVPQFYSLNFDVEDRPLTGGPTMWTTVGAGLNTGGITTTTRGRRCFGARG